MTTQISFQIDEQTLRDAEQYAREHGLQLTNLFTEYVEALARLQQEGPFLPNVEKMIGVAKAPGPDAAEEAHWAYLKKKYLKN